MSNDRLVLSCSVSSHVSVAFHQNAIPVIQELRLENATESDASDIEITITTDPAFASPMVIRVDRVAAGTTCQVPIPSFHLDASYLRKLTEGVLADYVISASASNAIAEPLRIPTRLQPPSHWGGSGAAPELVAAFVRPNDPSVDVLLHDASRRLAIAGKFGALDGYRSGGRERAWEIASSSENAGSYQ